MCLPSARFLNPSDSIKARIAKYIIDRAEDSGNTGNAFSMVAVVKDYRMMVVMPEGLSLFNFQKIANLQTTAIELAGPRSLINFQVLLPLHIRYRQLDVGHGFADIGWIPCISALCMLSPVPG